MIFDWNVRVTDLAIIFATLIGPILAVWAAEIRQNKKTERDRREWIFRTLMSTRSTPLNPDRVAAINHIEFAFPRDKFPQVDDLRQQFRQQMRNADASSTDTGIAKAWRQRADDIYADLVVAVGRAIKVNVAKADVVESAYYPDGHAQSEFEAQEIRHLTLRVLKHGWPINIRAYVAEEPVAPAPPATPPVPTAPAKGGMLTPPQT